MMPMSLHREVPHKIMLNSDVFQQYVSKVAKINYLQWIIALISSLFESSFRLVYLFVANAVDNNASFENPIEEDPDSGIFTM